jgi:hypothetical protein
MTDKKPRKPPETDPEQSERFRKAVRDLEAAGELSHTDGEKALRQILRRSGPSEE